MVYNGILLFLQPQSNVIQMRDRLWYRNNLLPEVKVMAN